MLYMCCIYINIPQFAFYKLLQFGQGGFKDNIISTVTYI